MAKVYLTTGRFRQTALCQASQGTAFEPNEPEYRALILSRWPMNAPEVPLKPQTTELGIRPIRRVDVAARSSGSTSEFLQVREAAAAVADMHCHGHDGKWLEEVRRVEGPEGGKFTIPRHLWAANRLWAKGDYAVYLTPSRSLACILLWGNSGCRPDEEARRKANDLMAIIRSRNRRSSDQADWILRPWVLGRRHWHAKRVEERC